MKPVFLEFCGINSFSEPAQINFRELLGYGIFGVFGDTGSGKTTILDCIEFALYGHVGRVSARENTLAEIVNYRCNGAYVNFEFENLCEDSRRTFRVERTLRLRKGAAGGCDHQATVFEKKGEAWVTVASGVEASGKLLLSVVGLKQEDFEKCIALPQGEFSQFVNAPKSERLKIIARLFNLERYGTELVARVNSYARGCAEKARLAQTRLEPYAEFTEERRAALQREIKGDEAREKELSSLAERSRTELNRLELLAEREREKARLSAHMEKLEGEREKMQSLSGELDRLGIAADVLAARAVYSSRKEKLNEAEAALANAKTEDGKCSSALAALPPYDFEAAEERIARLLSDYGRAEQGEDIIRRMGKISSDKAGKERELASLEAVEVVDFAAERAAIEEKLRLFGQTDFLGFLEQHGKEAFLREEYGVFRGELLSLSEKYPEITPDAAPLIEKYSQALEGGLDLHGLKEAFEAREKARAAADDALHSLGTSETKQEQRLARMKELRRELRSLEEEERECEKQKAGLPDLKAVSEELKSLNAEKRRAKEAKESAEENKRKSSNALVAALSARETAKTLFSDAEERFSSLLGRGGFQTAEEAELLVRRYGDAEEAKTRVEKYREDYAATKRRLRELSGGEEPFSEEMLSLAKERAKTLSDEEKNLASELAVKRADCEKQGEKLLEKSALEREFEGTVKEAEIAEKLKKLFGDNRFIEFVSEEYLQTIAANASARLLSLTGGRYFLRYGGNFCVGDNFNGGQTRGVNTLSGGETFLVSLSLALSLSTEICLRSLRPIEFFFLDEGFGTLDEKLVDTVVDSLERLRGENFSIGLISHVEELKHRIGRKLLVTKATESCGSKIRTE